MLVNNYHNITSTWWIGLESISIHCEVVMGMFNTKYHVFTRVLLFMYWPFYLQNLAYGWSSRGFYCIDLKTSSSWLITKSINQPKMIMDSLIANFYIFYWKWLITKSIYQSKMIVDNNSTISHKFIVSSYSCFVSNWVFLKLYFPCSIVVTSSSFVYIDWSQSQSINLKWLWIV